MKGIKIWILLSPSVILFLRSSTVWAWRARDGSMWDEVHNKGLENSETKRLTTISPTLGYHMLPPEVIEVPSSWVCRVRDVD